MSTKHARRRNIFIFFKTNINILSLLVNKIISKNMLLKNTTNTATTTTGNGLWVRLDHCRYLKKVRAKVFINIIFRLAGS